MIWKNLFKPQRTFCQTESFFGCWRWKRFLYGMTEAYSMMWFDWGLDVAETWRFVIRQGNLWPCARYSTTTSFESFHPYTTDCYQCSWNDKQCQKSRLVTSGRTNTKMMTRPKCDGKFSSRKWHQHDNLKKYQRKCTKNRALRFWFSKEPSIKCSWKKMFYSLKYTTPGWFHKERLTFIETILQTIH